VLVSFVVCKSFRLCIRGGTVGSSLLRKIFSLQMRRVLSGEVFELIFN